MIVWGVLVVVIFTASYFGPEIKQHFGSRYNEADRSIFVEGKAYVGGAGLDLAKKKYEYGNADDTGKAAIRAYVLTTYPQLDRTKLAPHIQTWLNSLENPQSNY